MERKEDNLEFHVQKWQRQHNNRSQEIVLNALRPIITSLSRRLTSGNKWSWEDLSQAGMMGITEAMSEWRPNEEASFRAIALWRARNAMLKYRRDHKGIIREPGWVSDARKEMETASREWENKNGRMKT